MTKTQGNRGLRAAWRMALLGASCLALAMVGAHTAAAQEIEPHEFTIAPPGTNLLMGYFQYNKGGDFTFSGHGATLPGSVNQFVGVARYVHFSQIGPFPAGFQIIQPYAFVSDPVLAGGKLNNANGLGNTILSAFWWPYHNDATKTVINNTYFIMPPDGTYRKYQSVNVDNGGWRGDVQLGITQGLGDHFSVDLAGDARFYGDTTVPGNGKLQQQTDYRLQAWANWQWNRALTTSIGYEGILGGRQSVNGVSNGQGTEEHRVRAAVSMWLSPRINTLIEFNHDVGRNGGFTQVFGVTGRLLFVF